MDEMLTFMEKASQEGPALKKAGEWDKDEEQSKQEHVAWIDSIFAEATEESEYDSPYVKDLPGRIKKEVPVVRTDGLATGLLSEVPGIEFSKVEYKGKYCYLDFTFQKRT